jgi:nucleoid-associated protein YgaU
LLLALGAAGVTLAVVLGVIGLPAVNACSTDPRGVMTCLRDMADRKFDLPGSIPGQVADKPSAAETSPPPIVVAETESPAASGGPLEAPTVEPAAAPPTSAPVPAAEVKLAAEPRPASVEVVPTTPVTAPPAAVEMAAVPEPGAELAAVEPPAAASGPEATKPDDSALSWSTASPPQAAPEAPAMDEPVAAPPPAAKSAPSTEAVEPSATDTAELAEPEPQSEPTALPSVGAPQPPLVVANAEPATARPPAPTVAAPVILAPTIDAIELDAGASFVSGSGPAGALMRLYADGQLVGESPVEEGRWLVEGSNLLDSPRRELRVEAIEPGTGKLLGVAAITVEIELPDGGTPPDERPETTPDLGSGVAPAPEPAPPVARTPTPIAAPPALAENETPLSTILPEAESVSEPAVVIEPEVAEADPAAEPELAAPPPDPLPPLAAVVPEGESASVEILAPSALEPTILPPVGGNGEAPSTISLPTPNAPALIAEFNVAADEPVRPPGQPVTILRLLPFGDPDEGRYNVGKAIIRRGDTLWSIARRYYGHGIHYRTIFHANRELIHRPWRIFPGQVFDLPLVTDD